MNTSNKRMNVMEAFADGARNGIKLVIGNMAPNTVFAFALILILNITGLMPIIGGVFNPVMGLFGLPGEAATPCVLAFVSGSAGIGAAVALITDGIMTAKQGVLIFPYLLIVGSMLQYFGRILGPSGLPPKFYKVCIGITILEGIISLFIMKFLLLFY